MSGPEEEERREAAAAWLAKLQSRTVSNAQLAEFARWRRVPANEVAYRSVERLWDQALALEEDADVGRMLADADGSANADDLANADGIRHAFTPRLAVAGVAVVLAAILGWTSKPPGPSALDYHTAVGERSAAVLSDGSRITIDTDTALTAKLANEERSVELRRGQAFFDVRHDAARPFVVSAGEGLTITALGTRFDVRRMRTSTRVALEDGAVRIAVRGRVIAVLAPGQSVEVTEAGDVRRLTAPVGRILSWREARLSFSSTPLGEAVGEMNRYTTRRLTIVDDARSQASVSGEFSVDDPEGFARAVNALFGRGTVVRSSMASDDG